MNVFISSWYYRTVKNRITKTEKFDSLNHSLEKAEKNVIACKILGTSYVLVFRYGFR